MNNTENMIDLGGVLYVIDLDAFDTLTLKDEDKKILREMVQSWNNDEMLEKVLSFISKRLNSLV